MNRAEFMKRLEELLADIPEEERVEALEYYEGYFEDGGPKREEEIIRELESPEVTAAMIQEDIEEIPRDGVQNAPALREQTAEEKETPPARKGYRYQRTMNSKKKENGPKYQYGMSGTDGGYTGTGTTQGTAEDLKADGEKKPWTSTTMKVILIIAIILVGVPIVLPLGLGGLGTVIALIAALICVCIALWVTAVAFLLTGVVVAIWGLIRIFMIPSAGIFLLGAGMITTALSLIAVVGFTKLCLIVYPAMFRWVVDLVRKLIHRKGEA